MANVQTLARPFEGSLRGQVFRLAFPAVGEQVLNTLVGVADIYLVGNLGAEAARDLGYSSVVALNSVGLGNQMIWLVTVLFIAVGIGSTALIARATGAGELQDVQRFLRQSMLIALIVGLLGLLSIFLLAPPFLLLLGASAEVLPHGVAYLQVISISMILAAPLFIGMACMRGAGDTRTPLYIMLGVNGVNVFITWLLVNGQMGFPALGVLGAATGSAIARGGGGIVVIGLLRRGCSGLQLEFNLRPDMHIIRRLLRIGMPTAGEQFIFHAALLIFTRFVTGLGEVAYAAHIATINIESFSFLPGFGYAVAASTLVGQALGAQSPERAEKLAYESLWQGMAMMSLLGAVMVAFPHTLLALLVNDPAAVEAGTTPLLVAGLVQPTLAVGFILNGGLRGAGDTRWPLLTRLLTTWGIRLPLTVLLVSVLGFGLNGIWLAMCTDFTGQALLALWRFGSGRWQEIEV